MVSLAETDQAERVVEQMVAVENHLADLYDVYSRRFPAQSQFWGSLAADERVHACWVCELFDHVNAGHLSFEPQAVRVPALQSILAHIEEKTVQAEHQDMVLLQALSTAADMEHVVIEKDMFALFTGTPPGVRDLRHAAIQETRDHFKRLLGLWNTARNER